MFVEDLPDDFDYQRILDENSEMYSLLSGIINFGSLQDEKGQWVTIRQLTGEDLDRIKDFMDRYKS